MSTPILTASLDHFRVANLLQAILGEVVVGRLSIVTPLGRGHILVRENTLVDAEFSGLTGTEAILSLLSCQGGEAKLVEEEVKAPCNISADPLSLLLEALRIQDHWDELSDRTLLRVAPGGPETPMTAALEDGLTVMELAERFGQAPVQVLPAVEALLESGHWIKGKRKSQSISLKELLEKVAQSSASSIRMPAQGAHPDARAFSSLPGGAPPVGATGGVTGGGAPAGLPGAPGSPNGALPQGPRATFSLIPNLNAESASARPSAGAPATIPAQGPALGPTPTQPIVPKPPVLSEEQLQEREYFRLLDEGRRAFRRNELDEAEALWLRAERLRPEDRTLKQNLRILQLKRNHMPT